MGRTPVNRHRNRQNAIWNLRGDLRLIEWRRKHANFTQLLSGYRFDGSPSGPYAGIEVVENRRHVANGDSRHLNGNGSQDFAGDFTKGLEHAPLAQGGLVVAQDYRLFEAQLDAIVSNARARPIGDEDALNRIDSLDRPSMKGERRPYTNTLSGAGAITNTIDSMAITMPPAPPFDGELMAGEMAELYWMAALRDLPFADWGGDQRVAGAIANLNALNAQVAFTEHHPNDSRMNPAWSKSVTLETLFRGSAYGVSQGPYISQFLLRSFRFGTLIVDQRYRASKVGQDFMTTEADWLAVQRLGSKDGRKPPMQNFYETGKLRHIATLRDLAHYVHFDALHEAYFNAGLILIDIQAPANPANPYTVAVGPSGKPRNCFTQEGFGTFGAPSALVILSEVATRALKAVWHQKWFVHRRLRPEAMGGRIQAANKHGFASLVDPLLRTNGAAHQAVLAGAQNRTQLLPMAFAEGSPMHPAYGAGHATVAGACVTILKAMFDPDQRLRALFKERQAPGDSSVDEIANLATTDTNGDLIEWEGDDLTVEGELNKLAANIAIGRNAAGVHYRSDYSKSLALGEAIAIGLLQELAPQVVEAEPDLPVWALPTFAGHWITIDSAGTIERTKNGKRPFPPPRKKPQAAPLTFSA